MTPIQIMAAITTAKKAEQVLKVMVAKANKKWPESKLFFNLATMLQVALLMVLCSGCMTYVRTATFNRSPVNLEGVRASVQGQMGVQTRGQHIPGKSEDTTQAGGGRADTALEIPVSLGRAASVPAAIPSAAAITNAPAVSNVVSAVSTGELSGVTWRWGKGFSGANAQRDPNAILTFKGNTAEMITYDAVGLTGAGWGDPVACLIYANKDAAKFEWAPASRNFRGWGNVRDGYGGGMPVPAAGEACGYVVVSEDGKLCSNVIPFSWVN
jgi:hypothetical protein